MVEKIEIVLRMEVITDQTPVMPGAKRGEVYTGAIQETGDQLEAGFVWWPCLFCGRKVLVDSNVAGRERCSCGAVRCHWRGMEGWRKNGEECWFLLI